MPGQYLLGIDVGTSGCKSILVNEHGSVVATRLEEYPLSTPRPGWYEQDPEDWWAAVKRTVQSLTSACASADEIKAIGLSGQMHGLVPLGKDGNVLRPCIIWCDLRNESACREVYDRVGGVGALLGLTNNLMLTGYTGGKLLWLRANEPQIYDRLGTVLNPKDYIRFRLTGELATEVSDASGTGLFNVRDRMWSYELLEVLDISKDLLPSCYESPEISGRLSAHVAAELGLPDRLPVVGGGGDAVIQCTGTGVVDQGVLGTTIGTGGTVGTALNQHCDNPDGRLQIFCNNIPGKWHAMGVMSAAGGSLRWLKDICASAENEVARWTGEDVYEILVEEASRAPAGSEGLIYLPYLLGERCPRVDARARGAFIGLTPRHNRCHLFRSLLEGVVFSLRDIVEVIESTTTAKTQVRTSGGGARSDFWRQIQADVFNSDVVTMSGSAHGAAYGAALVAGVGIGIWPNVEEAAGVLRMETVNSPVAEDVSVYNRVFPIYQGLYDALKHSFAEISSI